MAQIAMDEAVIEARAGSEEVPGSNWTDWTELDSPLGSGLSQKGYVQIRVRLETDDVDITAMIQNLVVQLA